MAAAQLLNSNTPITGVSDWPATQSNFFTPLIPLVWHGDLTTLSLIDTTKSNFRGNESLAKKLSILFLVNFYIKRPKGVSFSRYIRIVYGKRIKWRADCIKTRLLFEIMH
jgi:hypothetical protein